MTNLDSILKSRELTLPTKVRLAKPMVFPVVMYGCESWTVKKAECRRIDAFELWCWEGPLGTPLSLVQWKRASSLVEAGTSGFLSISDSDRRVPEELGQESRASSCVKECNFTCL